MQEHRMVLIISILFRFLDENLSFVNTCDIPILLNQDHVLYYYGKCLLEMCQAIGHIVANGRLLTDSKN